MIAEPTIIKSDEKLFKQWQELGMRIGRLNSIIQNDLPDIETDNLKEWCELFTKLSSELQPLFEATMRHIQHCNSGKLQERLIVDLMYYHTQ